MLLQGYWGGGTVFLATATLDWNLFFDAPRRFEHGTLPFLDIIALQHGEAVAGWGAVEWGGVGRAGWGGGWGPVEVCDLGMHL